MDVAPWVDTACQRLFVGMGFPPAEAAFLSYLGLRTWLSGLILIGVLWLVVRIEKPADWKAFFTLDRTDWQGVAMFFAILIGIVALEGWFLRRLVWDPIQSWLMNLGLWTEPLPPTPPRAYLGLNLIVVLLGCWLEAAEEIYFRGYLQRQMTERMGAFRGITLSLLLWDVWHLKSPATFAGRFFTGLLGSAILFHIRGRVWGPMVGHPLSNRLNVVQWLLRSRWLHTG